jgi:hypothetical protein
MRTRWQVRTTAAVVVAALSVLGGAAPALAQPRAPVTEAAKDLARQHYKAGEARFAEGNYSAALPLYEQAEAIIPIWQTKYKIAVCRDKLGQPGAAVRWYQTFLDSNPPEKAAGAVAEARARIAALSGPPPSTGGQVRVTVVPSTAPHLAVLVDNNPSPLGAPVSVTPGHHRIVVQADGFAPTVAELDVGPREAKEIRVTLNPVVGVVPGVRPGVPVGPDQVVYTRRRSNVPAYVLFGVAAVGLGMGAGFGVTALGDKSTFNKNPTFPEADKEQRDALISDVSFAVAIAAGVTGIILIATNPREQVTGSVSPVRPFLTPYAGPTGGGAVGGFTF